MLNVGKGFSDLFEMEAMLQADKLNSQSQYKEWMGNMKVNILSPVLKKFYCFNITHFP